MGVYDRPLDARVDLIVCADTVHTLDPLAGSGVEAVAMGAGRIVALGTRADVASWRTGSRAEVEVVDLGVATLTPGLTDSHIHPVMGARMTRGVRLLGLDAGHVREALAQHAAALPPGAWVVAWGLDANVAPAGRLSNELVDEACGGRPALVRLFDGHSALASSAALRQACVDGPRQFEQQAEVVCDERGRPTGLLLEQEAIALVEAHVPVPTVTDLAASVDAALREMASFGLTGGHALEHDPQADEVLTLLEADGDLSIRLRCSPWCQPGTSEADWSALAAGQGRGGRRWSVRGVKLFIDGTIDNGTAWLAEPDTHGESRRPFWPDVAAYDRAIAWFDAHDVPTATHAIGDQGVRHVLSALAATDRRTRHRIEHIETIPDDLIAGFVDLPVTASMQPTHCTEYTEPDLSDNWSRRLGPARAAQGWRTRDLRDAGVRVALGSDWPIAHCDPRGVLAAAQLRRRGGEPARTPIGAGQALSAQRALEGYTSHAAWSVGEDHLAGTLAPGKRADLTAFALDPLLAPADELVDAPIVLTVVDGGVVHSG